MGNPHQNEIIFPQPANWTDHQQNIERDATGRLRDGNRKNVRDALTVHPGSIIL
jgi:hypothetical protein